MSAKTGRAAAIKAYVVAHPGCTRAKLRAALGLRRDNGMLAYCVQQGLVFAAGSPRSTYRLFPTAEQAASAHASLVAEAIALRAAKRHEDWMRSNLRRRAERQARGVRPYKARKALHSVVLDPGVQIAPDVRITIAPPMRDRWAA